MTLTNIRGVLPAGVELEGAELQLIWAEDIDMSTKYDQIYVYQIGHRLQMTDGCCLARTDLTRSQDQSPNFGIASDSTP